MRTIALLLDIANDTSPSSVSAPHPHLVVQHAGAAGAQHAHNRVAAGHRKQRHLPRQDALHVVAHVREVEVNVGRGKVDVEGRDLLAQEQKVPDGEQLRVQRR